MALKFGTSGVRGLVTEMTDRACALYTTAFVQYLRNVATADRITIGGDHRGSTPRILRAVAHALRKAGAEPIFAGYLPTPALMLDGLNHNCGSIMVTGSHIPDDRNGIKFNLPWGEVLKADEAEISRRFAELEAADALGDDFADDGSLLPDLREELGKPVASVLETYRQRYLDFFPADALSGKKIVVYQHSAVIRDLLPELLEALGAEVVRVGWSDSFVPVDTEAVAEPERLAAWVKEHAADALVSADGDSDRPLVVDEQGKVIRGDVLGILVADYLQADAIATPVSCNTALELSERFEHVARTRIGSPYVVEAMNAAVEAEYETVVGYEANGGFLLATDMGDFQALPTRDAALPILAILHQSARQETPLSSLVAALPPRFTVSGLLREVPNAAGKAFVKRLELMGPAIARQLFEPHVGPVASWDHTDGARLHLADGRILHLRPSGNAPEFRLYTEADTEAAAQALNDQAAPIVRETLLRLQGTGSPLPPKQQRLANIDAMNTCPSKGTGMEIIIVSTTNAADARYWQKRLESTRGQITNQDVVIIAVHEDWPGGAGNGLGTLYALHKARDVARRRYQLDLFQQLSEGAAVALYHTAGKGTRMAPLPASEKNNKPAVKLAGLLEIDGKPQAITVLEAVIKQTGIYAASRASRLSVFWGDQVFIPSTDPIYDPSQHADIIGQLGPMPDAQTWEDRNLQTYGLLAVGADGNASQVEKISHSQAQELIDRDAISAEGGIGVSIGSFSMSAELLLALIQEFATELHEKKGKLDTDPHFWMPMTLDEATYLEIMAGKNEDPARATAHYARMQRFKTHLQAQYPRPGLLGTVNIGADSYWWDYGQLPLYQQNLLLALNDTPEGDAVRRFFNLADRRRGSSCDNVDIDDTSIVLASTIAAGAIRHSLLIGVEAANIEADHAVAIDTRAKGLHLDHAIAYNLRAKASMISLNEGQVRADVPLPDENLTMQTRLDRDGREDWNTVHSGNPCSYHDLHRRVHDASKQD